MGEYGISIAVCIGWAAGMITHELMISHMWRQHRKQMDEEREARRNGKN